MEIKMNISNFSDFSASFRECFEKNGFGEYINERKERLFYDFYVEFVSASAVMNLSTITDLDGVISKHFADCVSVARYIPVGARVIDVGCGAGFPSFPLAIVRPDIDLTSLDSTSKKIDFVNRTAKKIGLENLCGVSARAEEYSFDRRESYDVCVSRAVARLNLLSELCLPFVKVGGAFISMKSRLGEEEFAEAKNGITKLGATLEDSDTIEIVTSEETLERSIYVFKKQSKTPACYPRKYSQMLKKPL